MAKELQVIKYEGDNTELFKRISAEGLEPDAKLVVPETHNAILIKDGVLMDTLNSGSYEIFDQSSRRKSKNVLVEVIYLSKTARLNVLWGTKSRFCFRDPETDVPVKVGAHGEFEVQISNPRKAYMVLIGAEKQFTVQDLKERLSTRMMSKVEPAIARAMREGGLSFDRISEHKDEIAASVLPELSKMFEEDYGLKIFSFTIASVIISDEDIAAIISARGEREVTVGVCPFCGAPYSAGDNFCAACGRPVGGGKVCKKCGKLNKDDASLCAHCGTKL